MKVAQDIFHDLMKANRNGSSKGIYSVCSAHPDVLEACIVQAKADDSIIVVESTSNQVDQYGGYTGMKPADFVEFVSTIAEKVGFPKEMILLGGDHLGPNPWKKLPAQEAMEEAKVLIAEYVKAGFQKIHLDTSMFLADDEGDRKKPLADEIVADRAAILCGVAEKTWEKHSSNKPKPIYVIGTEVPIPGGAQEQEDEIIPTLPEDAASTITVTRDCFLKHNLENAWERVVGVVVQPGVEFSDDHVFHYQPDKAQNLSKKIQDFNRVVYEAHSTDYQTVENLEKLVKGHFCILKVGPWLTFAYREAMFSLEAMEIELLGKDNKKLSRLKHTLESVMLNEPKYWKPYYHGDEDTQAFKRKYSFSDRSRYYWAMPEVESAKNKLIENLENTEIPLSLLSQFMPKQFYQVCDNTIKPTPKELTHSHIRSVAEIYSKACGLGGR